MQWSDLPTRPSEKTIRQFTLLWVLFFGGLALWHSVRWHNPAVSLVLSTIAFAIVPLWLIVPEAVRFIFVSWLVITFPLGWFVSHAMLAFLYYVLFTPTGLMFKLIGRDALSRRRSQGETYWATKASPKNVHTYVLQY